MWLVRFVAHLRDDLHRFFCIHCHSNGRHTPREILLHNLGVDIINFYDGSRDQPAAVYFTSPIVNFNHWLHFIDHKTPSAHSPIGKWGWMHINARYISDMAYDIPQLHLSSYGRRGFPFRYWHPKNGKNRWKKSTMREVLEWKPSQVLVHGHDFRPTLFNQHNCSEIAVISHDIHY